MKLLNIIILAITLCASGAAYSQLGDPENTRSHREVLRMGLYPPDVIMRHQQKLGITDQQRSAISEAVRKFQNDVASLQWEMQNEQQLLRQSLSEYEVDSEQALAHAEKVLTLESRFKRHHFELLIAVKNELTREQIDMIKQRVRQMREREGK